MKQGNLLQFGMRFLPAEGEIAADSPAVPSHLPYTPATSKLWPATASKAAERQQG